MLFIKCNKLSPFNLTNHEAGRLLFYWSIGLKNLQKDVKLPLNILITISHYLGLRLFFFEGGGGGGGGEVWEGKWESGFFSPKKDFAFFIIIQTNTDHKSVVSILPGERFITKKK